MADTYSQSTKTLSPVTADAFLADRQRFWGTVTSFVVFGIVAVAVVLLVVLYFIL
jgi:hypothetical protein